MGSGLLIDFPKAAQAIIEEDPQDKVSYMVSSPPGQFVLGNAKLPEPPAGVKQRLRVQVAKSLAVRERIARELVFDMIVPLLLLGLVFGALVYAGIAA